MAPNRKSMQEQELETPRGQLNELWLNTMELASAGKCRIVTDERKGDLHDEVGDVMRWADDIHGTTGAYPDQYVRRFLTRVVRLNEHMRPSDTGTAIRPN